MKRPAIALITAVLSVSILSACGRSSNVTTTSSSAAPAASGGTVIAEAGTKFSGKLQQEISTKKSRDGDRFTIENNGTVVDGHLEDVHAAGLGKKPSMVVVFDDYKLPDGTTAAPIDVNVVNSKLFDAKSHHWRTFGMVVGGAIAGHMAAKAANTKHGSVTGAASGYVLSQEMKTDVDIRRGTTVELRFNKDAVSGAPAQQ